MIVREIRGAIFLSGYRSAREMSGSGAVIIGPTMEYLRCRPGIDYKGGIIRAKR